MFLSSCLEFDTWFKSFTKFYISCLHHMSIFTAWYLATYTYKIIFKNFQVLNPAVCFLDFRPGGRPHRSTGSCVQDVHACARLSVDRPDDRPKTMCSLFFLGRPTGRPPSENCPLSFCPVDRPVDRSAKGSLPAGLTVDRAGRPPSLPAANGSFLFCVNLKICFWSVLWQILSEY